MTISIFIKYTAVVIAAVLLGRWFDKNRTISRAKGQPWYTPWKTIPGVLIIIILIILVIIRIVLS